MVIPLNCRQPCGHLPQIFRDLVAHLRSAEPIGSGEIVLASVVQQGLTRCAQSYVPAMIVEESRMLQLKVFDTSQKSLINIDFSVVLLGVMTIADEIDSQLSQAMWVYGRADQQFPAFITLGCHSSAFINTALEVSNSDWGNL